MVNLLCSIVLVIGNQIIAGFLNFLKQQSTNPQTIPFRLAGS